MLETRQKERFDKFESLERDKTGAKGTSILNRAVGISDAFEKCVLNILVFSQYRVGRCFQEEDVM